MLIRGGPQARASLLRRAGADRQGLAALEFALIAPLMIVLYFGLAELSSAIIAGRHVNHATSALGDLVSQCSNVNDSDLSNMFSAASDILAPLPLTSLTQTVSSVVQTDSKGTTQVQWSRRYTGSASGSGTIGAGVSPASNVALPSNVVSSQNDTVIVTETTYTFAFPFSPPSNTVPSGQQNLSINFVNGLNFDTLSYFKPRKSTQVTYTGASASGGTNSNTSCYSG